MRLFQVNFFLKIMVWALLAGNYQIGLAQYYSLDINDASRSIEGAELQGHQTQFLQPGSEVKKAWWRYIKSKAVIYNKLTHYELKFPAQRGEKEVYAISILESNDSIGVSKLFMALKPDSLASSEYSELSAELETVLLDFKVSYFTGILQDQIKDQEKRAQRLSGQIEKLRRSKNKEGLSDEQIKAKEDGYLYSLNQIEQNLDSLKIQLRKIK